MAASLLSPLVDGSRVCWSGYRLSVDGSRLTVGVRRKALGTRRKIKGSRHRAKGQPRFGISTFIIRCSLFVIVESGS